MRDHRISREEAVFLIVCREHGRVRTELKRLLLKDPILSE